ncbi:arginyl-trna synthetase [Cystoisospora suis]|uniref:arginine--tRNA ligase n=1 Tax=Cystoisospora suis TaxID=483139 RepID=A0A2C6L675_9APIC|nr:arginyl-trna synthetase [Cystoisospora suis]
MLHRALPLGTKTAVQTDGHDDTQSPPIVGLKGWLEAWLRRAVMIALSREPQAFDIPITVTESIAGARSLFDFQSSIAIALAGRVGSEQGPEEIAEGLLRNLERSEKTNRVVALTAVSERGFINVRLADRYVASQLAAMLQDGGNRLGIPRKENPRNIVVDYASPNICKELHVGHLRSAVVGDVIANLLEFAGHHVWRQNHLGDFGWPVALVLGALDDPDLQRLPEVRALKQAVNDQGVESALPAHISDLVATEMRRLEKLPTPSQSVLEASVERDLAPSRRLTCVLSLEGQCEDSKETKSFDLSWGDIYTAAHRKAEKDAEFKLGCEGILLEMQRGSDHHVARTWKKLRSMSVQGAPAANTRCVQGFLNIYELLRLKPQEIRGESFYAPFFPEVLAHLQRRGLLTCTPDSVLCHAGAEVEGRACGESGSLTEEYQRAQTLQSTDLGRQEQCGEKKMEALVLQKRSGTLTYAATDLAAVVFRSNVLQADQILYVVDNAQAYHFRRLFYAARQAGIGSHRSVLSAEGRERETQRERTAGRGEEGQKHDCEDYLEEPGTRPGAHKNFQEKKDESSAYLIEEEDAKSVGNEQLTGRRSVDLQHVGIGLVKDQSGGKMTSRGGGAPRLGDLLAHAITKAENRQDLADVFCFDHSALDRQLAVRLLMFPIAVEEATTSLFPSKLTAYLFSLCLAFNAFYEQCEVLGATDVAVRLSRYLLVSAFVRVLEKGLELLGIDTLDKM